MSTAVKPTPTPSCLTMRTLDNTAARFLVNVTLVRSAKGMQLMP